MRSAQQQRPSVTPVETNKAEVGAHFGALAPASHFFPVPTPRRARVNMSDHGSIISDGGDGHLTEPLPPYEPVQVFFVQDEIEDNLRRRAHHRPTRQGWPRDQRADLAAAGVPTTASAQWGAFTDPPSESVIGAFGRFCCLMLAIFIFRYLFVWTSVERTDFNRALGVFQEYTPHRSVASAELRAAVQQVEDQLGIARMSHQSAKFSSTSVAPTFTEVGQWWVDWGLPIVTHK